MARLVSFDGVSDFYCADDPHRPTLGGQLEVDHPRTRGFLSKAIWCRLASSPKEKHGNMGIINFLDFTVQHIKDSLVTAARSSLIGVIGASAPIDSHVLVVVDGIWEFDLRKDCDKNAILYADQDIPGFLTPKPSANRLYKIALLEDSVDGKALGTLKGASALL